MLERSPWFAICVKTRHEKYVALALHGKGYETFLPTYRKQHRDRRIFELPLFPGYVFSRVEPTKTLPVLTIPGVFSIVSNGRAPEPISEQELESVRTMVESRSMPVPWPYFPAGEKIFVEDGPFRGVQGVLVDATNEKWFVLSIDFLQRSVAVKVERDSLRLTVHRPARTASGARDLQPAN